MREMNATVHGSPSILANDDTGSAASSATLPSAVPRSCNGSPKDRQKHDFDFAFEGDLFASRVYRGFTCHLSDDILATTPARSTAHSILSAHSLADVSNVSFLAIPIYSHEISNGHRYARKDFRLTEPPNQYDSSLNQGQGRRFSLADWDASSSIACLNGLARTPRLRPDVPLGFAVPLVIHQRQCENTISLTWKDGESYMYGYIPRYLWRICVFLKARGKY